MLLEIPDVLSAQEVERVREAGTRMKFIDGRASNPHSQAKNNLQADPRDPLGREISQMLTAALAGNEQVKAYAFPNIMLPPTVCKYAPGMTYGVHADAAFLPMSPRPVRSDLSCTIFIADPATYDGGELTLHLGTSRVVVKGAPGSAVVYPSTTLHEVTPVTRGERLVAITFIESLIVDQTCRELLYQLNEVAALEGLTMSWENRTRLSYVTESLKRMWGAAG